MRAQLRSPLPEGRERQVPSALLGRAGPWPAVSQLWFPPKSPTLASPFTPLSFLFLLGNGERQARAVDDINESVHNIPGQSYRQGRGSFPQLSAPDSRHEGRGQFFRFPPS